MVKNGENGNFGQAKKRKAPLATFASIFSESSARVALLHVSREALPVITVFPFPRESLLNVYLRDILQWSHLVSTGKCSFSGKKKFAQSFFINIFINYSLLLFLSIKLINVELILIYSWKISDDYINTLCILFVVFIHYLYRPQI